MTYHFITQLTLEQCEVKLKDSMEGSIDALESHLANRTTKNNRGAINNKYTFWFRPLQQ